MDERMDQDVEMGQELDEMECEDRLSETMGDADDLDEDDEARDQLGEMSEELWQKIRDDKKGMPSMFVSGWEEDEQGVEPGDPNQESNQFLTAAENGDLELVKEMITRNPDLLHVRDRDFYTPLHRAAYSDKLETVEYLLSLGADPMTRTEDGWSVLHSAACWGAYDVVAALLKRGVDVNCQSNGALTPLHLAINSGHDKVKQIKTMKYLLDSPGIDMAALSRAGETPLSLAQRASPEILEVLQSYLNRP